MNANCTIEISTSAYLDNIAFIRKLIGDEVIFSSVLKGNAYGHGIAEIVPIAQSAGIEHFSVFNSEEAKHAKKYTSDRSKIMIMGYIPAEDLEWVIAEGMEFFVSDLNRIRDTLKICANRSLKAIIHLEVETGLNRTGLDFDELRQVVAIVKDNPTHLYCKGLCTHLAGAESIANYYRIHNQIRKFRQIEQFLRENGINPAIKHTACSAATITYPETRMDLVRIGILQYGFWPSKETFIHYIHNLPQKQDPLHRVLSWKSKVMAVKKVRQGEFIGYGNNFMAFHNMKIAIIPVGYSDGYSRALSNQGKVLINGERISIVGMVNMNMVIANVYKLPDVKVGDEVVIIGKQGKNQLTVASFSELSNQVNYELLTRLPQKIERKTI